MTDRTTSYGVALPLARGAKPGDDTVRAGRKTTVLDYGTERSNNGEQENLPSVAFVVLAQKDADSLDGCLETIASQEYPERLVETVVVKGAGCKGASEVAHSFNAAAVNSDLEDTSVRINLGIASTKHAIVFAIGADGGLPRTDWIRLMVRPFIERPEVGGVFTQMVEAPTDGSFARYLCRINGDPFAWFVHGDTANPRYCRGKYGVAGGGDGYELHLFPPTHPPLIPADHGVGARRSALHALGGDDGTSAPLIRLIEGGQPVALVPDAGFHHQNPDGLRPFLSECCARLYGSADGWPACPEQHPAHRSLWRRVRRYLFELYGLTAVMPLLDGLWLSIFERNPCMLRHGPAVITLSWLILIERVRRLAATRMTETA